MRWAQRGIVYYAKLGELERALADVQKAVEVTRNSDRRIEYKLLALALGLRLGRTVTSETVVAGIPRRDAKLWHSRLTAVLMGGEPYDSLARQTVEATRRAYLLLADGIRAELAGDRATALARYREAAEVPRPTALPCVMAGIAADALTDR
jgi:tetratricopeptide (TPR) repeat protein